jgi:hypothetical protein
MKGTHGILIAAQPHAAELLQAMLRDIGSLITAHTTADAFRILEHEQVDLIVSTIAFDESRMLEFLVSVEGDRLGRSHTVPLFASAGRRASGQSGGLDGRCLQSVWRCRFRRPGPNAARSRADHHAQGG